MRTNHAGISEKLDDTCFVRPVEDTKTPGALARTSRHLYAELIFCVRLEVIDLQNQFGAVDHLEPPQELQVVPNRVVAAVGDTLASAERRVGPRQGHRGGGVYDRFQTNRWHHWDLRLRSLKWNQNGANNSR